MSTPFRVSTAFLNTVKALFPENTSRTTGMTGPGPAGSLILRNPWYIVAAVSFSASNRPEGVPRVFEHALTDLRKEGNNDKAGEKLLAQKFREALFKSGLISGYSKTINALKALHDVMPEELRDTSIQRNTRTSLAEYERHGDKIFESMYGETGSMVQGLLDTIYPDMGWFSKTIGYGVVYGHVEALSTLETTYAVVAALIASDTPLQIGWHLNNARTGGASIEEVRAVREISIEVAKFSGIQWRHKIPEI